MKSRASLRSYRKAVESGNGIIIRRGKTLLYKSKDGDKVKQG